MRYACLLALLLIPFAVVAQDKPEALPRKWTYGSFGVAMRPDLTIYQGGARNAAGEIVLTTDDRLLTWNGLELKTLDDFCRNLYATKPGQEVEVTFERTDKDTKEKKTLSAKIKLGDPRTQFANLYAHKDKRQRGFDWNTSEAAKAATSLRTRATKELTDGKLLPQWDAVVSAHERELDLWDCYESTSACELLLKDPLASDAFVRAATDSMREAKDAGTALIAAGESTAQLRDRARMLRKRKPIEVKAKADGDTDSARHTAYADAIETARALIDICDDLRKREDFRDLHSAVAAFEFAWQGQPGHDKCVATTHHMRRAGIESQDVVHQLAPLLAELTALGKQAWEENSGKTDLPRGPDAGSTKVEGDHLKWGGMILGGPGKNIYTRQPLSGNDIIIDLGGDDEYIDCARTDALASVQIVIDLGGNDRYRSTTKWGVACGVLGTAIIYDAEGDDTYECGEWGIGAAFGGVGLILDAKGNDRYLGGTYGIGCAAYGVGGVIDLEGNDLYDGKYHCIGVGEAGGVGFVLDRAGDDVYRCTGLVPSSYGTAGEWSGWGIGCGFGWRGLAGGGTGLVVDVAGNDIYSAGEFGLGCGYFLGIGMVRDMAGDDIYHSSRYGLAAAAHCAVGLFMDDAGHDTYEGKTAASMGGVWDIVTGYFCDGGGNDIYRCDGLGLGACSQNGFGIFWEAGGDDVYRTGGNCIGYGGGAEYGGGRLARNFGLFFDCGGKDSYPAGKRADGAKFWEGEYGLFADD